MDLLEYQAKELFAEIGIPILPSQCISHPADLKGLRIPYPVVLKSQVRAGGRGKAGGVKFVENTIDAVAAAQAIVNLPIMGDYPEVILAEAKYNADREFYLAVVLDANARRPVLLGSNQGGIDLEAAIEEMQVVVVDQGFSPFYARRLVLKMGIQGQLIQAVSDILEKMYRLFIEKDLDLVEINPLGVSADGSVMALDGKVTVNDEALSRHQDLVELLLKNTQGFSTPQEKSLVSREKMFRACLRLNHVQSSLSPAGAGFSSRPFHALEGDGNIGVLCNGTGLLMATLDLLSSGGGLTACCLNIAGELQGGWLAEEFCVRIERGLEVILNHPKVEVLLVNLISTLTPSDRIAEVIVKVLERRARSTSNREIPFTVRLVGDPLSTEMLQKANRFPIRWVADLEAAVSVVLAPTQPSPSY